MSFAMAAAIAPAIAFATGAQAQPSGPTRPDGYNATINQGNVPTTAKAFSQDCNSDEFANKPADSDGWLFVASPSNFQKLQAQFNDGANVVDFSGANTATAYYTKVGDHVAVITPGGWTLTQAFAELDGSRDFFVLSHTCAATSSQPQQSTPPSASTGDTSCTNVTFNLSAGSNDTTFTVTPTNGSSTDVKVTAGNTTPYSVSLDSAHPGATVTANGQSLASYTRPDSCNDSTGGSTGGSGGSTGGSGGSTGGSGGSTGGSGGNTGGSSGSTGGTGGNTGGSSGSTGGTGGNAGGSSTSTGASSGTTSGGTTGGGTTTTGGTTTGSTSSGGATSSVLGEKFTNSPGSTSRPPTLKVKATRASRLPFTGFGVSHAVEVAALLMLLGFGALFVGRRRAPAHNYIRVRY